MSTSIISLLFICDLCKTPVAVAKSLFRQVRAGGYDHDEYSCDVKCPCCSENNHWTSDIQGCIKQKMFFQIATKTSPIIYEPIIVAIPPPPSGIS